MPLNDNPAVTDLSPLGTAPLIDPFGRTVDYLRVSVTDRCDFRCVYCMAEEMTFLPKAELLSGGAGDTVPSLYGRRCPQDTPDRW